MGIIVRNAQLLLLFSLIYSDGHESVASICLGSYEESDVLVLSLQRNYTGFVTLSQDRPHLNDGNELQKYFISP